MHMCFFKMNDIKYITRFNKRCMIQCACSVKLYMQMDMFVQLIVALINPDLSFNRGFILFGDLAINLRYLFVSHTHGGDMSLKFLHSYGLVNGAAIIYLVERYLIVI